MCSDLSAGVLREVARRHRVVAVVESHLRGFQMPRGWRRWMHRRPRAHDLERIARRLSVPWFLLTPDRNEELRAFVSSLAPDAGVIAKMAQLLPPAVIEVFPRGVLNVHPSLLPKYRGPNPVFWTYFHEERTSGVTVHFIDAREDTGDIVKQVEMPIAFGESSRSFARRCAAVAPGLVADALDELRRGVVQRRPQDRLPCPFRGRYLKENENPIPWDEWSIERVYHALRGAEGIVDVLPRRAFPRNLFRWEVVGFEKRGGRAGKPAIRFTGLRFVIPHREGRIVVRPRVSVEQARRALRVWRAGRRTNGV